MKQIPPSLGKLIKTGLARGGFNVKIDSPLLLGPVLSELDGVVLVVDGNVFDVFDVLIKDGLNIYHLIEKNLSVALVAGFSSPLLSAYQSGLCGVGVGRFGGVLLVSKTFYEKGSVNCPASPQCFIIDGSVDYLDLVEFLESSGYTRVDLVVSVGEFAVRGGVVDFFVPSRRFPVRCSFLEDLCQINDFDINSQISFGKNIHCIEILFYPDSNSRSVCLKTALFKLPLIYFCPLSGMVSAGDGGCNKDITICKSVIYNNMSHVDPCLRSFGYALDGVVFRPKKYFVPSSFIKNPEIKQDYFRPHDIDVGDYVVHEDFGVGVLLGFVEDRGEDVAYAIQLKDGIVRLGLSRMSKISFYSRGHIRHALGSLSKRGVWGRKKALALKASHVFVEGLVDQYAKRLLMSRPPYKIDSVLEKEFLDSFDYVDTLDQSRSWEEIKCDLCGVLPMNRLLCGDVGFGKTEIAIRASFVVVLNGGSVVVLCPTTILCKQIYDSFSSRFLDFGISVGMVSRLNLNHQNNKNILDFNSKKINVLVGTHALIQKSDVLKHVNLLIIDEEQRFGVAQKESFLDKNPNIDVLLMSATPIPRSLQLSLSGLRDLSLLQTPPKNRLPIKTEIVRYSQNTVRSAVAFEVSRGGQVYYLNNNIREMSQHSAIIKEMGISFDIVHGKMVPEEIKKRMFRFVRGEVSVLLSTTIIENGIDVPNANTILINDAHLFGVSQLHQIRGRVGRSFYQGFAYLMVPKNLVLGGEIRTRLLALEKNIVLGSGYALSNKDLEIRGGGTPFGYKQSGLAWSLGFELYNKIIQGVIFKKGADLDHVDGIGLPCVDLNLGEKIPRLYLPSEHLRLSFYNLLTKADSLTAVECLVEEMNNRFGVLPDGVRFLVESKRLSLRCVGVDVLGVSRAGSIISIFFGGGAKKDEKFRVCFIDVVDKTFKRLNYNFKYLSNNRLVVSFKHSGNKLSLIALLNRFINNLELL